MDTSSLGRGRNSNIFLRMTCLVDFNNEKMDLASILWIHSHLPIGQLSTFEKLVLSSLHVPCAAKEVERIATLHQILSSPNAIPNDKALQSLISLARRHFGVAIAAVSLVDIDVVFSMISSGMEPFRVHRNHSICTHAILSDEVTVIPDASKDLRVLDIPLVICEGGIKFYAGAAIVVEGQKIGALCIIDPVARYTFSQANC
ncbi:GAF domain-containing protein, partial [archaeon]